MPIRLMSAAPASGFLRKHQHVKKKPSLMSRIFTRKTVRLCLSLCGGIAHVLRTVHDDSFMLPLWIPVRGVYPARMKIRTLQALGAACLVVAMAPAVFANGRFPRAQRVIETPAHPEQLVIAATYGLLVT